MTAFGLCDELIVRRRLIYVRLPAQGVGKDGLLLRVSRLMSVRLSAGGVEGWFAPAGEPFDICPTACGSVGG